MGFWQLSPQNSFKVIGFVSDDSSVVEFSKGNINLGLTIRCFQKRGLGESTILKSSNINISLP
jgi:hypothetical protein